MQSAMQMFVARFASKYPRIRATTGASVVLQNAGVLQLRFRMTAKNHPGAPSSTRVLCAAGWGIREANRSRPFPT